MAIALNLIPFEVIESYSRRRSPLDVVSGSDSDSDSSLQSPSYSIDDPRTDPEKLLGAVDEIISLLFRLSVEIHDEASNSSEPRGTRVSAPQITNENLRLVVEAFPDANVNLCERLAKAVTARHAALKQTLIDTGENYIEETDSEISSALSEYYPTNFAAFGNSEQSSKDEWQSDFVCPFCSLHVKVTSERHLRWIVSAGLLFSTNAN